MAEKIYFLDAIDGAPEYDSAQQAENDAVKFEGVAYGYLNALEVTQTGSLQVSVDSGAMVSKGRTYIQDEETDGASPLLLAVDAATSGYVRKDLVVIEYDISNNLAMAKIVKGTEAASDPSEPSMTDTASKWQTAIALLNISGNQLTSGSEVTDRREYGSKRMNPRFAEDISAPNIVAEDGYIYLNAEKTAYIKFGAPTNRLVLKLPGCDIVQIATLVVGTTSAAPEPTEEYPINTMYLEREA